MFDVIWRSVAVGIGATVLMDLWAIILYKFFGQNMPNWAPVGRWFWHLKDGKVFHDDINKAQPYAHELALGWISHYAVGILYGIFYGILLVIFAGAAGFDNPSFILAWILGIVTVGAGWFLLQPGLGLGWAASKTPNPTKVRCLNLVAHTVFAIGLWGTALLIR